MHVLGGGQLAWRVGRATGRDASAYLAVPSDLVSYSPSPHACIPSTPSILYRSFVLLIIPPYPSKLLHGPVRLARSRPIQASLIDDRHMCLSRGHGASTTPLRSKVPCTSDYCAASGLVLDLPSTHRPTTPRPSTGILIFTAALTVTVAKIMPPSTQSALSCEYYRNFETLMLVY